MKETTNTRGAKAMWDGPAINECPGLYVYSNPKAPRNHGDRMLAREHAIQHKREIAYWSCLEQLWYKYEGQLDKGKAVWAKPQKKYRGPSLADQVAKERSDMDLRDYYTA